MSHNLKWWQCQETSRSISLNYVKNGHGETFHFLIALPSTTMVSCCLTMVERICGISFCLLPSYDCLILWLTPTLWLTKMSKFSLLLAIFPKWRRGPDVMFKALQWLLFLGSALARQVWSVVILSFYLVRSLRHVFLLTKRTTESWRSYWLYWVGKVKGKQLLIKNHVIRRSITRKF